MISRTFSGQMQIDIPTGFRVEFEFVKLDYILQNSINWGYIFNEDKDKKPHWNIWNPLK
jgi:hypothetical protein